MSATPNVLKNPVFGWKAWHKTQWDGGDKSPDSIDFSKTSVSPSNISQAELLDTSKDTSVNQPIDVYDKKQKILSYSLYASFLLNLLSLAGFCTAFGYYFGTDQDC